MVTCYPDDSPVNVVHARATLAEPPRISLVEPEGLEKLLAERRRQPDVPAHVVLAVLTRIDLEAEEGSQHPRKQAGMIGGQPKEHYNRQKSEHT
jgi:hypothetical protein